MKKKLFTAVSLVLLLTVLFVGCGSKENAATAAAADSDTTAKIPTEEVAPESSGDTVTITHQNGTTDVPKNPQNVVVMDFGMLDTIDMLGLTPNLAIPANNLPAYLKEYEDTALNIGGLKEYDMEKIHGFEPDLIIIGGRQADNYDALAEIAPTINMSADNARYLDSSLENIRNLGMIFEQEDEVEALLTSFDEKLATLADFSSGDDTDTLILLTNEGNMSVYGTGSRFGILHDSFGFPPVDSEITDSTHGQEVNYEYLSKMNPDYIFVVDRSAAIGGEVLGNETLNNDLVNSTNAAKNDHIIFLNPDVWYLSGGGLQSLTLMIDEVSDAVL